MRRHRRARGGTGRGHGRLTPRGRATLSRWCQSRSQNLRERADARRPRAGPVVHRRPSPRLPAVDPCVLGAGRKSAAAGDFFRVTAGHGGRTGMVSAADADSAASAAGAEAAILALDDDPSSDGRVARGQRIRRNVADALVVLLAEGDAEPTAPAVAARAGVSARLVFHHFADMDDLYHYVTARQRGGGGRPCRTCPRASIWRPESNTRPRNAPSSSRRSGPFGAPSRAGPRRPGCSRPLRRPTRSSSRSSSSPFARARRLPSARPRRAPRGDGLGGVVGGVGPHAADLGPPGAQGAARPGAPAAGVLPRRRGRGPGPDRGGRPAGVLRRTDQPGDWASSRRRTSGSRGAGYSSLPGRQPASSFCRPGPSAAHT